MPRAPPNNYPQGESGVPGPPHTPGFRAYRSISSHGEVVRTCWLFSKASYTAPVILGFRELESNPLLCLVLYKLLLNSLVDFEFLPFKRKCKNCKRSIAKQQKCLMECKISHVGKD